MKKNIIALAVAASMASAAYADGTTLYGSVRLSVEGNITEKDFGTGTNQETRTVGVKNNSSRWGIKGSEDLGNGLSAFYKYEFGIKANDMSSVNNGGRLGYVGLKGGFGSISLGRQWSPYYNVMGYNDIFNGSTSYALYQGPFRLSNTVAYTTPEMGGFQAQLALIVDGSNPKVDNVNGVKDVDVDGELYDGANIGVSYSNNGIFAGATFLQQKDVYNLYGLAVGYSNDNFRIGATASEKKLDKSVDANKSKSRTYTIAGEYYLGDSDIVRAGVEMFDDRNKAKDIEKLTQYTLGYQHNFSKRTRVWAEYAYLDGGNGTIVKGQNISIGLRTDF